MWFARWLLWCCYVVAMVLLWWLLGVAMVLLGVAMVTRWLLGVAMWLLGVAMALLGGCFVC